jgi:PAS domain S-box-containing protein
MRALIEHSSDASCLIDAKGRVQYASPSTERVLGYSSAEFTTLNALQLTHPDDMAYGRQRINQCLLHPGKPIAAVLRYKHKNGEWRWIEMTATNLLHDPEVSAIVVNYHDITERKQAEEAVLLRARVLESMVEGVSISNAQGIILYTNPAEDKMFGYERGELVGQHVTVQNTYPPEENERIVQEVLEQLKVSGAWQGEFSNRKKDGTAFTTLARITTLDVGGTRYLVCVQEDITARKRAENRQRFLADASQSLATSLDYQETLRAIAHAVVPSIADSCAIYLTGKAGDVQLAEVAHVIPAKGLLIQEISQRYPRDIIPLEGWEAMVLRGEAVLLPEIEPDRIVNSTYDAEHKALLRSLGIVSALLVPLTIRGRVLGALSFSYTESGRRYSEDDFSLAKELAERAGIALENARLYQEAQEARHVADQAAERIGRLQAATAAFAEAMTPVQVGEVLINQGISLLGASGGGVGLLSEDGTMLELLCTRGYPSHVVERYRSIPITAPVPYAEAPRTGESIWLESSAALIARYPHLTETQEQMGNVAIVNIPLTINLHTIGVLSLQFAQPRTFTDDDRAFMKALAQQCAQAMERAHLFDAEQRARRYTEIARSHTNFLAEASRLLSSSLDYETTLVSVAHLAVPTLADWCGVDIPGDDGVIHRLAVAHVDPYKAAFAHDIQQRYPPDPNAPYGVPNVMRTGRPEFIPEISEDRLIASARDAEHLELIRMLGLRSYMAVPMVVRGQIVGVISFAMSESGRHHSPTDLALAEELARRAAQAIDNAHLYANEQAARSSAEHTAQRMTRLYTITTLLSTALTASEVANVVVTQGYAALGAVAAFIALLDDDGRSLHITQTVGYRQEDIAPWQQFSMNAETPATNAIRTRSLVLLESPEQWYERYPGLGDESTSSFGAWAAIPLLGQDKALGVMVLSFDAPQTFSADDRAFMLALAQQFGQALERARLYDTTQQARAEAEVAVRLRDQFLTIASHELKTPLTSLMGNAEAMQRRAKRDPSLNERDERALNVITNQAKRLNRMITALLDISRLEQGQLAIERVPVDLTSLVRRIVDESQPNLHQHVLVFTESDELLIIAGDEVRLEQVFQNLIQNAVKYSPKGGAIMVGVEREGKSACVSVADQGIGIPPTDMPKLFQRFYRASNADAKHISGMGVGLYIVKEIVEQHGGKVQVDSVEGDGTTFTIILPLADPIPAANIQNSEKEHKA